MRRVDGYEEKKKFEKEKLNIVREMNFLMPCPTMIARHQYAIRKEMSLDHDPIHAACYILSPISRRR